METVEKTLEPNELTLGAYEELTNILIKYERGYNITFEERKILAMATLEDLLRARERKVIYDLLGKEEIYLDRYTMNTVAINELKKTKTLNEIIKEKSDEVYLILPSTLSKYECGFNLTNEEIDLLSIVNAHELVWARKEMIVRELTISRDNKLAVYSRNTSIIGQLKNLIESGYDLNYIDENDFNQIMEYEERKRRKQNHQINQSYRKCPNTPTTKKYHRNQRY